LGKPVPPVRRALTVPPEKTVPSAPGVRPAPLERQVPLDRLDLTVLPERTAPSAQLDPPARLARQAPPERMRPPYGGSSRIQATLPVLRANW
jgi:hypothetical protein